MTVFPIKPFTKCKKFKSWLTRGIKNSSKTKRKLYNLLLKGEVSRDYYKAYSSVLKKVVIRAKQMSNKNYLLKSKNSAKAAWNLINHYTGKDVTKTNESVLINIKIGRDSNKKEIVDFVNDYFVNQANNINCNTNANNNLILTEKSNSSFFLVPTDENEVYNTIMGLKNIHTVGHDEIPVITLKKVAEEISAPLTHIINLCFEKGIFPKELKISEVRPIYKKGDKSLPQNYRPIAILSNISKIFEKIIHNRLMHYVERFELLSTHQNGFRKAKSTTRAIYQALHKILTSLNLQNNTALLCLDLSKAFDNVRHDILLKKLEWLGIRGIPLLLFKSYLSERYQYIKECDESGELIRSGKLMVRIGVPQGSILGPLLYIIYTYDMEKIVSEDIIQFADDSSAVITENNTADLCTRIVDTVKNLETYFASNGLKVNLEKTQMINFHYRGGKEQKLSINFNNNKLEALDYIHFLGIGIDSRLDWKLHITELCNNLAKYVYALGVISQMTDIQTAMMAYHSYVGSRIRYGIVFWGSSVDIHKVFVIQKRILRRILKISCLESCKGLFKAHRILTLHSLYIYESVMFVCRNYDLFGKDEINHCHETRSSGQLTVCRYDYTYLQRNVHFQITKIYNKVHHLRNNYSPKNFERNLKNFLIDKAYYSLQEFMIDGIHF